MPEGRVRALFVTPEKKARPVAVPSVRTSAAGFDGDYHAATLTSRQVLLVSASVLEEFGLQPGALFENVTVDGFDVMRLSEGQKLRLGTALVEVTTPCEPCIQMERVKPGLRDGIRDRRGMFVRVVEGGAVAVGDSLVIQS